MTVAVRSSDQERREIYRVLHIRDKLISGQAYLTVRWEGKNRPRGNFPAGSRSQIVDIRLAINDYLICMAHRYVDGVGREITEPDPKRIEIDDLALIEERIRI